MRCGRTEDWGCGGRTPFALAIVFWPSSARALHDFGESFSNRWRPLPVFGVGCGDLQIKKPSDL